MQPVVYERPLRVSVQILEDTANIGSIGVAKTQKYEFRADSPHESIAECRRHYSNTANPGRVRAIAQSTKYRKKSGFHCVALVMQLGWRGARSSPSRGLDAVSGQGCVNGVPAS
jgi:hypothetical protein